MNTTQDHIPIKDVQNGIVLLKDGGAALVLKTSAVNFGLLSEEEQIAIIGSFAQMLNSLSFSIQIIIHSKRLDISSYLKLLDKALQFQNNPLLAQLMVRYRSFVQSLIKENEVLDKSFYVCLPVSSLELGISAKTKAERVKKAQTILLPRRDQIIRQLARVGLSASHLESGDLIKLFYDIYNPPNGINQLMYPASLHLNVPQVQSIPQPPQQIQSSQMPITAQTRPSRSHPFVIEELMDTI